MRLILGKLLLGLSFKQALALIAALACSWYFSALYFSIEVDPDEPSIDQ
jgi:hypothetical protein